jgi:hypothetical protein
MVRARACPPVPTLRKKRLETSSKVDKNVKLASYQQTRVVFNKSHSVVGGRRNKNGCLEYEHIN